MDDASFARLEGKIDGLNIHMSHLADNWKVVSSRVNSHSERLTSLESKQILATGERQGTEKMIKVLWAILAVLLTGGVTTIGTAIWAIGKAFG